MEYLRISDASEKLDTFTRFMELPKELRLEIWSMSIEPRLVPYNATSARRSRLKIDGPIQPLLHVCHESRMEALKTYCITNERPYLAICPEDTLLWIRYTGPRTFRVDAQRLEHAAVMQHIRHLALSIKFWNRITTSFEYDELYRTIRTAENLKHLSIVDDEYGRIKWGEMKGMSVSLKKAKWPLTAQSWDMYRGGWSNKTKEALWKSWDAGVGFPERELPEVRFMMVQFSGPEK